MSCAETSREVFNEHVYVRFRRSTTIYRTVYKVMIFGKIFLQVFLASIFIPLFLLISFVKSERNRILNIDITDRKIQISYIVITCR